MKPRLAWPQAFWFFGSTLLTVTILAQAADPKDCATPSSANEAQVSASINASVLAAESYLYKSKKLTTAVGVLSDDEKTIFREALRSLFSSEKLPAFTVPPEYPISKQVRRQIHIRRAAFVIWTELTHRVSWSLEDLSAPELEHLVGYLNIHNATRAPLVLFADMDALITLKDKAPKTGDSSGVFIANLADWVRANVRHRTNGVDPLYPESTTFALTNKNWGSCHNVGDFLWVASTANLVPVDTRTGSHGHRFVDFPHEQKMLVHGDDPYGSRNIPADKLAISGSDRTKALKLLNSTEAEATKFSFLYGARRDFDFPPPAIEKAACKGEKELLEALYVRHNCTRCPNLRDYPAETEAMVRENYATLRAALDARQACK